MKHIHTSVIEQDDLTGDLYVIIPEEVLSELSWEEGDVVEWEVGPEGELMCRKIDEDFA